MKLPVPALIGLGVILGIGVGFGVGYLVLSGDLNEDTPSEPAESEMEAVASKAARDDYPDPTDFTPMPFADDLELMTATYPFKRLVVNLSDTGFLRCSLHLEFYQPEAPPGFRSVVPRLQDAFIEVISRVKLSQLKTPSGKENLKILLSEAANEVLGKELVRSVYFSEFILQQ